MTVLSGKEFNKRYKGIPMYRFNNEDENHGFKDKNDVYQGFQYETGLNVDTIPFNPIARCSKGLPTAGGLTFTDVYHVGNWSFNKTWVREVTVPDDAKVYVDEKHFKADKIILGERMHIRDYYIPEEYCLAAMKEHDWAYCFINQITPEIQAIADQEDEWMIRLSESDSLLTDVWGQYFYESIETP